jgi:hypothetical protein
MSCWILSDSLRGTFSKDSHDPLDHVRSEESALEHESSLLKLPTVPEKISVYPDVRESTDAEELVCRVNCSASPRPQRTSPSRIFSTRVVSHHVFVGMLLAVCGFEAVGLACAESSEPVPSLA